jgi:hypothetical protein
MSRFADAFETMAERGEAGGATALLERTEASLVDQVVPVAHSRPRALPGFAVAVIVFTAVIAIRAVWALLGPHGELSETSETGEDGIEWLEAPSSPQDLVDLTAGPGGLLQWTHRMLGVDDSAALRFSADGSSWVDVTPTVTAGTVLRDVETSNDRWMLVLEAVDGPLAMVSSNARTWTPVTWPDDLAPFVADVIGSGSGFVAVGKDPFDAGTTLWWSADGVTWSRLDVGLPGPSPTATLAGTLGGMVWYEPLTTSATQTVYHIGDGNIWIAGEVTLPPAFAETTSGWLLQSVEFVDDTWFAIAQAYGSDVGSDLLVWTSPDGIEWVFAGSPSFGSLPDSSVGVDTTAVVGDRLVVGTMVMGGGEFVDGTIRISGSVELTGQLWATPDGSNWTRTLDAGRGIRTFTGTVTESGNTVGLFILEPSTSGDGIKTETRVETTIAPAVDPADLDQAGLDLQAEIVSDGEVTRDEFEQAMQGWKSCMEEHGITGVTYDFDARGDTSFGWASPTEGTGEVEDAICRASYVDQVSEVLATGG